MKWKAKMSVSVAMFGTLLSAVGAPNAAAQQVTGTPGSASATTTIDGKQIPPPRFGKTI